MNEMSAAATVMGMVDVVPGARRAFAEMADTEAAWLHLAAVSRPEMLNANVAEVERRWEVHQERARTTTLAPRPKAEMIESVIYDVASGLL